MSNIQKNSFIRFFVAESHKKEQQNNRLQKTIDDLADRLSGMQLTWDNIQSSQEMTRDENTKLNAQLSVQSRCLKSILIELKKALGEADKYKNSMKCLERSTRNRLLPNEETRSMFSVGDNVGLQFLTPVYRDMIRLFELKFRVSRQTILNWLSKGSNA